MVRLSFFVVLLIAALLSFRVADTTIIATVDYSFSGCFSGGKGKLVISSKNDVITAELNTPDQKQITALLTQPQMKAFKKFVKELKTTNFSNNCTTQYEYIVHYENEIIKKTDGSCKWEGFSKLTKQLFNLSY